MLHIIIHAIYQIYGTHVVLVVWYLQCDREPGNTYTFIEISKYFFKYFCQTPGSVFRLGVNFVLPLSQEQEEQEQEEEEEEPLTKIYQNGVN